MKGAMQKSSQLCDSVIQNTCNRKSIEKRGQNCAFQKLGAEDNGE